MTRETLIKVSNPGRSNVGYKVSELGVRRIFVPGEIKEIPFKELQSLSYTNGGRKIISDYLLIEDEEALKMLVSSVEPEYYYSKKDIINLFTAGSLDEFLDCLDFAPDRVLEQIKQYAVDLPLNDVRKRNAILEKLNFDVTKAIEVKNTKFDGQSDDEKMEPPVKKTGRRVSTKDEEAKVPSRRSSIPKYNVVSIEE